MNEPEGKKTTIHRYLTVTYLIISIYLLHSKQGFAHKYWARTGDTLYFLFLYLLTEFFFNKCWIFSAIITTNGWLNRAD